MSTSKTPQVARRAPQEQCRRRVLRTISPLAEAEAQAKTEAEGDGGRGAAAGGEGGDRGEGGVQAAGGGGDVQAGAKTQPTCRQR